MSETLRNFSLLFSPRVKAFPFFVKPDDWLPILLSFNKSYEEDYCILMPVALCYFFQCPGPLFWSNIYKQRFTKGKLRH